MTHYRQWLPLSPSRSSLSHTQSRLLVYLLQLWPSLASLHTQLSKSPEMIWPHQRLRIIHSAPVGLFCIPDSQRDWIFHLHTRLLSNVTHTILKQHCHTLLASSVFPHCHFLLRLEQRFEEKKKKEKKTEKKIKTIFLWFSASSKESGKAGFCFVDRNTEWPFSAGSRLS